MMHQTAGIAKTDNNKQLQWNLAIPATLGTNKSGWISKVGGSQGKFLM